MIIVKIKCTKDIREKFKKYGIDKRKLENFLNYHTNNLKKTNKWWYYEVGVKGINSVDSQYFWGEDEIEVALRCNNCNTKNQRRVYFLSSLVHEYRHWVQCKIEKVSSTNINYSDLDVAKRTDTYTKNKYELECAEWEVLVERFIDLL